jgi:hypothetical protein
MSKKVPVNICPETIACSDMGDVLVILAGYAICGSHAFQHIIELFMTQKCKPCQKFLVSLKSSDKPSLLITVTPLSL